jgi:CDP-diacylglycerol--glycerol-3-phosphate 3-phosphatidyltransferase
MSSLSLKTRERAGEELAREKIWNLPNGLTLIRIGLVPPLFVLLFFPGWQASLAAALTFAAASLTDFLDGYLARRHCTTTRAGKFLDPLADKLLITVPMVMFIPLARVPAWMVALILAREMGITGLRGIASAEGLVLSASSLAKYKTAFQSASIIALLVHYQYFSIDFHLVGLVLFVVAFILTLWSGADYVIRFFGQR